MFCVSNMYRNSQQSTRIIQKHGSHEKNLYVDSKTFMQKGGTK